MPDWTVPLSDVRLSPAEVDAVAEVYRSGWLSQGPRVAEFESAFADCVGIEHAVAVGSGTAALHLIAVAIGLGEGDEVVLPSLTFAATAAVVVQTGATPVFADIAAVTRPWLSPRSVEAVIGPRTRAIVAVSYGGHPGELSELRELARRHGLDLLEDSAHGLGAWYGEGHVGTAGRAGAFSFFANKNLPLGEGGMAVTAEADTAERLRRLRSHGLSAGTWERYAGGGAGYEVLEPGYNYRLDEPRARLGRLLLHRLAADNARRADLAARYRHELTRLPGIEPALAEPAAGRCAWHIFPVVLAPGLEPVAFRQRLRLAGVQTSLHYPPLHRTAAFGRFARDPLPVTDEYARRAVTLPLFAHMSESQLEVVVGATKKAVSDLDRPGRWE